MTSTAAPTAYFDNMTNDERWLGWGYLQGRSHCEDADLVARNDAIVLEQTARWSDEQRFQWANSKLGRWVADGLFGGTNPELVINWGYFKMVK